MKQHQIEDTRLSEAELERHLNGFASAGTYLAIKAHIRAIESELKLAREDGARLDWLERSNTLHQSVELLYVVDGYEVQLIRDDGATCCVSARGESLRSAIDAARTPATGGTNG